MTGKYLSAFASKRGRPKQNGIECVALLPRSPSEYVDFLWYRKKISLEEHLAVIYYRTLYYQVHSAMGMPQLVRKDMISLSERFGSKNCSFSSEEKEAWYIEKVKTWKKLRLLLNEDPWVCLPLIDDLIIHKSTHEGYFERGLNKSQKQMFHHALVQIAKFFGILA